MSSLKIVIRIAAFAGLLLLPVVQAQASGCCAQDCSDAYGVMLANGIPTKDATAWYRDCLSACEAHGDPTTCPKDLNMAAGVDLDAIPAGEDCGDVVPGEAPSLQRITGFPASPQSTRTNAFGLRDRTYSSRP